jgi:hypothetical protein
MTRLALGFSLAALLAAAPAAQDTQALELQYRAATLAQADGDCTTAAMQYAHRSRRPLHLPPGRERLQRTPAGHDARQERAAGLDV